MAINNATYPPIENEYRLQKDLSKVTACRNYVNKYEKHILEWEHDDYTQVEVNDIIEELTW
jgi:hypothetical protein